MGFHGLSGARNRSGSLLRTLSLVLIVLSTPLVLPAQNAELLPVESQFLAPLMKELNPPKQSSQSKTELLRTPVRYELVSETAFDRPAEIMAETRDGFIGYNLRISRSAVNQPLSYLREILALAALTGTAGKLTFGTPQTAVESYILAKRPQGQDSLQAYEPMEMAETLTNMKEGSLGARFAWETHVLAWLKGLRPSGVMMSLLYQWDPSTVQEAERVLSAEQERLEKEILPKLKVQAEKDLSRKSREWDRINSEKLKALEQEELKLNDLIVRNDRKGVRRLLEAYLPWSVMEPVEKRMWQSWLEAIEFPDPAKKTIVFRGVDYETDFMQTLKTPEGLRVGFMSTLLTKNQGSYTRRLRSLKTKRLGTGDEFAKHWKVPPHVKISEQMRAHAIDPIGSAFLSFTMDPAIASAFVGSPRYDSMGQERPGGGLLAVAIDSRRLFPNLRNGVTVEMEYLAPLVVFPDEVLEYREISSSIFSNGRASYHEFLNSIRKKFGNVFRMNPGKDPAAWAEYQRDGKAIVTNFFETNSGRSCGHVWK